MITPEDPLHRMFGARIAPNGVPVRENFEQWFTGSVVVKADGTPAVLYHGTPRNFDAMKVSARGTFGSGIYCTTDPVCASTFAGEETGAQVMPVFLALHNPYRHLIQEPEWIDSWGEGLVKELFNKVEAERIIRAAAVSTGDFGADVTEYIRQLGHDGIVARYKDGSREVVAFRTWQVKSAIGNSGLFDVHSDSLLDRVDRRSDGFQADACNRARPAAPVKQARHQRDEIVLDFGHYGVAAGVSPAPEVNLQLDAQPGGDFSLDLCDITGHLGGPAVVARSRLR